MNPIHLIAIGYAVGVAAAAFLNLPMWTGLAAFGAAAFLAGALRKSKRKLLVWTFLFLASAGLALAHCRWDEFRLTEPKWNAVFAKNPVNPNKGESILAQVECMALKHPRVEDEKSKTLCSLERVKATGKEWEPFHGNIRVVLNAGRKDAPEPGDLIRVEGNLADLRHNWKYKGSDIHLNKISASIFVKDFMPVERPHNISRRPIHKLAARAAGKMAALSDRRLNKKLSALLRAMTLGDVDGMEKKDIEAFKDAGCMHVLVVSGLHISLLLGIFLGFRFSARRGRWIAYLLLAAALAFFVLMTGAGPSTVRAFWMAILLLLSFFARREYDARVALSLAALLTLLGKAGASRPSRACLWNV